MNKNSEKKGKRGYKSYKALAVGNVEQLHL